MDKKLVEKVALVLVLVGAVNWGLVGLLGLNVVGMVAGAVPLLEKGVYILVGAAGLSMIYGEVRNR